MFERYTEEARVCLFKARLAAAAGGGAAIEPEHLLLGILRASPDVLRRNGVSGEGMKLLEEELTALLTQDAGAVRTVDLPFSPRLKLTLDRARAEADSVGDKGIAPEHLLLACLLLEETSPAANLVMDAGVTIPRLRNSLANQRG